MGGWRKCGRCGKYKVLDDFALRSSVKKGLMPRTYCKECDVDDSVRKTAIRAFFSDEQIENERLKKRQAQNLRLYGVTEETVQAIGVSQNWLCAICSTDIGEKPYIDHNHETGQVRKLLCFHCNVGLGHFRDSIDLLDKAQAYLKENS